MSRLKEVKPAAKGKLTKYKQKLLLGSVFLVLITSLFLYKNFTSKTDTEVTTAKVTKTDLRIAFSIDGKLAQDKYEPEFAISGKVIKVLVKEGDRVKRGQWLALLDSQEAQKNLEKALRDYSKERNDFDQDSQVTYVDTIITDTIRRILEKNQWDLDKAVLDVELKDLALQQSRSLSPTEGIVAQINIKDGDVVSTQSQNPIIIIVKPDVLSFVAYAEEDDALKITDDQTVSIALEAYDKEQFPAKLTFLSPLATVDANGLASYKVTAGIENPNNLKLMDGMEGSLSFITKEVADVLTIPNKAVRREGSQAYVLVQEADGSSKKATIETGFTDGKNVEVVSGLILGQEIILNQ